MILKPYLLIIIIIIIIIKRYGVTLKDKNIIPSEQRELCPSIRNHRRLLLVTEA